MATRYVLTALPHSLDPDEAFHVSVVVSPRLSPDGTLADFPVFEVWPDQLAAATLTLTDHTNVAFTITPKLPDDPTHWTAVFPSTTPVTSFEPQSFEGKDWHSYSAARMDALAKVVHLVSMASDPVDPPLPSRSPLGPTIDRLAAELWRDRERPRTDDLFRLDETRFTRFLDNIREPSSNLSPLLGAFVELHRVRRFYERPESAATYFREPVEGAENTRPKPLGPDFHQRVALLGDQPSVLRALGLIVDLQVTELDRLAAAQWLTARVVLDDGTDPTLPTRTRCQVDNDVFTTVPRAGDWNGGRLRLGDAQRFTLLDLDPDASGLKLERFLVTMPRLMDAEQNDDPVSAASPTLRATGFAVARNERVDQLTTHLDAHQTRANALGSPAPPLLDTEDVTKGVRVEVWDQTAKQWFSLHRRSNALTLGDTNALDVPDEQGFLQGAAATETPEEKRAEGVAAKTYLGETMFGWSGWSLSAPHPALRPEFRYEGAQGEGAERMEEVGEADVAPAENSTNVVSRPEVFPGSLPRLRYGRSYAFRAWGVDLAGNSPPHPLPGAGDDGDDEAGTAGRGRRRVTAAERRRPEITEEQAISALANHPVAGDLFGPLVQFWRGEARRMAALAAEVASPVDPAVPAMTTIGRLEGSGPEITGLVSVLIGERRRRGARAGAAGAVASRVDKVRRTMRSLFDNDDRLVAAAVWSPGLLAALAELLENLLLTLDTCTPLRPLWRWHPVDPPVIVPVRAYREGESLRHLVIRSGVDVVRDPELGDTLTVVDPTTYAAQVTAEHPEIVYHDTCERHLAPPRTSQPEAELHGRFDGAIGSTDPGAHLAALLAARREAGTFLDQSIPSLTDPGDSITIDYLRLEASPGADPAALVDLDDLEPGDPLASGQYLVAETTHLILPYLPDPAASGVSLRFPDAGTGRPAMLFPSGVEGVVADLNGTWPALEPYRLVLRGGTAAQGMVTGNVIDVTLPAGDTLRAASASAIDAQALELFGLWNLLPPVIRNDPDVRQAALDGWIWALSPAEQVRLVHAVPRPLEAPRPTRVIVLRGPASTSVLLFGGVDLHGPTTSRLDADATWEEPIDDPIQDGPERRTFAATAFTTEVAEDEDLLILAGIDQTITLPSEGSVRLHASRHELGDTKHKLVDYRFRATSRFTEYFHPTLVDQPDDRSVVGPKLRLSLPNAARPPKPLVREVVPLLRWEQGVEPEQPFALRRTRRSGLRIYLERPWFATGDGELLAVICAPTADDAPLDRKVSQWGADPAWRQRGPAFRPMLLELDHLFHQAGFDDRQHAAYPVGAARRLPLVDADGQPNVVVLGYRPRYDERRRLWFVDVAIDPGSAFWPFVRVVVARYQPESLPGLHLSPTVRLDYAQVVPARTATLSRVADDRVQVLVTGPVGHRGADGVLPFEQVEAALAFTRRVVARLEQRDPTIASDLGWTTVATRVLDLEGFDASTWLAAWDGSLTLPAGIAFQQPGTSTEWRVTVEEFELFPADRPGIVPPREPRVVYADHLPL